MTCYTDNSNSFLAEFKKELLKSATILYTSVPENQRADFAESAIRITGQRLSRLLADPEFSGPSNDWMDVLPDLCRTINRCPLKSPFAGLSREQLHFGGTNENFCPLALQFREEPLDAVEIPCEGEIE